MPNGKLYKLDGHTRALGWARKMFPAPLQLNVVVYPVKSMEEVESLYKDFDSKDALETNVDKVSGAFHRHNFEPQSDLLKSGQLTYALRVAYGMLLGLKAVSAQSPGGKGGSGKEKGSDTLTMRAQRADIYTMVDEFSYELHALDAINVGRSGASSGVISAFIVSYRRYGHKITPFWQGVFSGMGTKSGGRMDGIQALCELMLERKGKYGGKAAADVCSRALMAVEKWLKDEMVTSIPRPLDTTDYLLGREKPTERLIKKADIEKTRARA
jgi:hypothetical protein